MTVKELSEMQGFRAVAMPDGEREISGVYIGDLLSWVMGRAKADDAWITIMSNINIVAVASLADVACILLTENAVFDDDALTRAKQNGVIVLRSAESAFDLGARIAKLI